MGAIRREIPTLAPKAALAGLAATQYGVFSRGQARGLGVTDAAIRHGLRSGSIHPMLPRVYCIAGSPESWMQRVIAATLWGGTGSFASHMTAAALRNLLETVPAEVTMTTTRDLRSRKGLRVHRVREIRACDAEIVGGIPITETTRTLLDIAGQAPIDLVEVALDRALHRRLTTIRRLGWRLNNVGARGQPGAALLRGLLDERPLGTVAPESPLEGRFIRLLSREGLPPPQRQYVILADGVFVARVDFAYPGHRLAIEVDGYAYHSGKRRWEKDLERRNAIEAEGWRVLNLTKRHIDDDGSETARMIRRIITRPGRG